MAQQNRVTLNSLADTNVNDNTSGDISPLDIRTVLKNLADSNLNLLNDDISTLTAASDLTAAQILIAQGGFIKKAASTLFGAAYTPSALTRTNDTNITLTLGGTPTTSLLQSVSLTLGWTGTLADSRIASATTWNAKEAGLGNPSTNGYVLSSTTGGTRSWVAMSGGSSSAEPFTATTYAASLSFDILSLKEKNFDITGFNGNLTIAFTNMVNGASSSLRLNKTSASALTVTFPANTTIICNTPDCVVASDVVTVTSATGTKYVVNTTMVGTDLISVISRVDVDENYSAGGAGVTDGDKGDITVSGSGSVWTLDPTTVTYAKMQNVSVTNRLLGRITAGAGSMEELTGTQVTSLLNVFTTSLNGLVPAPVTSNTTDFLRRDGTWATPAGGGGSGIPLTGTTTGNQVTGPIKLGNAVYIGAENSSGSGTGTKFKLYDNDAEFSNGPTLLSDASIILNHNSNFNGNRSKLQLTATLFSLSHTSTSNTHQIDIDTNGIKLGATGQKVGFFGGTPVVRQTGAVNTAGVAYTSNEQAMIQKCYDVLRAFNLMN